MCFLFVVDRDDKQQCDHCSPTLYERNLFHPCIELFSGANRTKFTWAFAGRKLLWESDPLGTTVILICNEGSDTKYPVRNPLRRPSGSRGLTHCHSAYDENRFATVISISYRFIRAKFAGNDRYEASPRWLALKLTVRFGLSMRNLCRWFRLPFRGQFHNWCTSEFIPS